MKKLLLCTTALAGLVAGSAFADDKAMTVTVTGTSKFEVGTVSQSSAYKAPLAFSPNQKSTAFWSNSKASIKAEGKTADNLVYGAVIRLATVGSTANGIGANDTRNDRSHVYLDTDFGSLQLGSNAAASKLMQVNAGTIASATGGVDGDMWQFVNLAGRANGIVATGVDTLSNNDYFDGTAESNRKVTYMSPRFAGVQFGVSYTPDTRNNGANNYVMIYNDNTDNRNSLNSNTNYFGNNVSIKNAYSLGLNYMNSFNNVDVALAATYDGGKAVNSVVSGAALNNLKTWSLGGSVGTNGFTVAAAYGNNGKSLVSKGTSGFKSTFWNAGVAYANGPLTTSLTYLNSTVKGTLAANATSTANKVTTQSFSLGADYTVAPGLTPFAEVSTVKIKADDSQKATVFILGTKVKF